MNGRFSGRQYVQLVFQNFENNPKVGFLFMIPGMDVTARVNGRVRVVEPDELATIGVTPEVLNPDGNAGLIQGLMLMADEAYFHCPRSFQFAELWNTDIIAMNRKRSIKDLKCPDRDSNNVQSN